MLTNYLKIALRNLTKNKIYGLINIVGLAAGLSACLVIGLYVMGEYRHDRFHQNFADIYRIVETQKQVDGYHPVAVTPGPLAPALEKDFPDIVHTTRVGQWSGLLKSDSTAIEPKSILIVENSFFKIFDFQLLAGDTNTVLQHPDEILITETLAEQFFGKNWAAQSVLGRTITLNNEYPVRLAGVVANPPTPSHLQFQALLPFNLLLKMDNWSNKWASNNFHTYLQLHPQTDVPAFAQKLAGQLGVYHAPNETVLHLQPLRDIYLHSKFDFETDWGKRGDIFYVRIFTTVGLVVLLIAIFNYFNLVTARAAQRAKEVGVRKSIGANRQTLVLQFLTESMLMTTTSVGIALVLAQFALPLFNRLTDKSLVIPVESGQFWGLMAGTTLLLGLITGAYPAFFLSGYQPSKVLKGLVNTRSGLGFRKVLVVAQFAISVALGISTVVIYQQLNFVQAKNLGFDQSHLLYLNLKGDTRFKAGVIKEQVTQLSGVASVTATTNNLVDVANSTNFEWEGQTPGAEFLITQMNIDADFLATTGMEMASGRNYSAQITRDTAERDGYYLVNETAARRMGYNNETVLNKKAKFWGNEGTVIGVVKDFHFRPLNKNIEPFIFRYRPQNPYFQLLIKTKPEGTAATIAALNQIYKKADPDNPIKFGFVDQALEAQYKADQRAGRTVLYFSILAILVSCLGLLGLTAFAAEQRTKEISIRKVLGATVAGIAGLLARDFIRLVVLAIVIATPVAYFGMEKWLANFAYRIDIQWWMLAVVSVVAVVLAGLTVGVQGVKAALANPAHSLRKE